MLAHNQPIYCYNIESFDINKRYTLEYELPKTNKKTRNTQTEILYQSINSK